MAIIPRFILISLALCLAACGGSSDPATDPNPDEENDGSSSNVSALGSVAHLTYQFSTQTATDDGILQIDYPETYMTPIYIKPDGGVTLLAREFPRMVLRICPTDTADENCDVKVDLPSVQQQLDLVFDLCGKDLTHSQCGDDGGDPTTFEGSLSPEGRLVITSIDVRIRVFLIVDGSPNGYSALDTDAGILPLPRLEVVVQTDPEISTGILSGIGERVSGFNVKLVAGGIIPEEMPELGGAHYLTTMTGTFDVDVLGLLE